jgi:uncharacterized membrane protein
MTNPGSKTRLVLILALAASLLLNALALGAGLRLYQARQSMLGDSADITLPRDLRRDLGTALRDHADQMAPALKSVQDARRDAVLSITAQPYDPAAASQALDHLRTAMDGLMQGAQRIILTQLDHTKSP